MPTITLYGSGTPSGSGWSNPENATGAPDKQYATYESNAIGDSPSLFVPIQLAGIPSGQGVDSVSVVVKGRTSASGRTRGHFNSRLYAGGTPVSNTEIHSPLTNDNDSFFAAYSAFPSVGQLNDGLTLEFWGTANTTSNLSIRFDSVEIEVSYSPLPILPVESTTAIESTYSAECSVRTASGNLRAEHHTLATSTYSAADPDHIALIVNDSLYGTGTPTGWTPAQNAVGPPDSQYASATVSGFDSTSPTLSVPITPAGIPPGSTLTSVDVIIKGYSSGRVSTIHSQLKAGGTSVATEQGHTPTTSSNNVWASYSATPTVEQLNTGLTLDFWFTGQIFQNGTVYFDSVEIALVYVPPYIPKIDSTTRAVSSYSATATLIPNIVTHAVTATTSAVSGYSTATATARRPATGTVGVVSAVEGQSAAAPPEEYPTSGQVDLLSGIQGGPAGVLPSSAVVPVVSEADAFATFAIPSSGSVEIVSDASGIVSLLGAARGTPEVTSRAYGKISPLGSGGSVPVISGAFLKGAPLAPGKGTSSAVSLARGTPGAVFEALSSVHVDSTVFGHALPLSLTEGVVDTLSGTQAAAAGLFPVRSTVPVKSGTRGRADLSFGTSGAVHVTVGASGTVVVRGVARGSGSVSVLSRASLRAGSILSAQGTTAVISETSGKTLSTGPSAGTVQILSSAEGDAVQVLRGKATSPVRSSVSGLLSLPPFSAKGRVSVRSFTRGSPTLWVAPPAPEEIPPFYNTRVPQVDILFDGKLYPLECINFQIDLDSMPLNSEDSSGGVGEISLSFIHPQDPDHPLNVHGYEWAYRKVFEAKFGEGYIAGTFVDGGRQERGHIVNYTGVTSAQALNIYNVVMPPYEGTLGDAIQTYIGHLKVDFPTLDIPNHISDRLVVYPGWTGEFWHHLKMLCAAEDIDILFTHSTVKVRDSRHEEGTPWGDTSRSPSSEGATLAQHVEVYDYQNEWITDELVYPPGGWSEDVEVLSVGEDEYIEHTLELSTSLSSFQEPVMKEFVERLHMSSSVYTIVGDDGFPIKPAQWVDAGGRVDFEVGEEFNTFIVKMRGAREIFSDKGEPIKTFSLALSADSGGGSQYSTLRIVGTGVRYKRGEIQVGTGVPLSQSSTDVGVTIDNPFLSTPDQAYNAAIRAVTRFQGYFPSLSIESQGLFDSYGIMTGETLTHIYDGGQVYRTRQVVYSPEGLSVSAEGDLRLKDLSHWEEMTVSEWDATAEGLSCLDVRIKGTRIGR